MKKVIITVPKVGDRRFKQWAKLVKSVDTSKTNGYAFEGNFLTPGRKAEVETGILIVYGEEGSRANRKPVVAVVRVKEDASLEEILRVYGMDWVLEIRDKVAELVAQSKPSREALEAEAAALRARLEEIERLLREM